MLTTTLQDDIRNLATTMVSVARRMDEANPGNLQDVKETTFQMKRIAVLLIGYAPQEIPVVKSEAEYREHLFKVPAPLPVPRSSLRTRISDDCCTEIVARTPELPLSGSAK